MRNYWVEKWDPYGKRWERWVQVMAWDRNHAASMILGNNPLYRFRVV